jgi:hypothetical protein
MIQRFTRASLMAVALAMPGLVQAVSTRLELHGGGVEYGREPVFAAILHYEGGPCPAAPGLPSLSGTLTAYIDGIVHTSGSFYRAFYRECQDGKWTAGGELYLGSLDIGMHTIEVAYSGEPGLDPAMSRRHGFAVSPTFSGTAPSGEPLYAGVGPLRPGSLSGTFCARPSMSVSFAQDARPVGRAPPPQPYPYGFVNFSMQCSYECGFLCPAMPPTPAEQLMQLMFPFELPASTSVWVYAPHKGNPDPEWQRVPATMQGRLLTLTLRGGTVTGPSLDQLDGWLRGSLAVSFQGGELGASDYSGMWWGGPGESGWGLSIAQTADRVSGTLFIYDAEGNPTWLDVVSARWDPGSRGFIGDLQRPNMTNAGYAVIGFDTEGRGTLTYEMGRTRASRPLARLPLPPNTDRARRFAGSWHHAPYGGGLAIDAAGEGLFVSVRGYDAQGNGTWLVVPAGEWTSASVFEGRVYRTRGSPWLQGAYDASRLRVEEAGSLRLAFDGPDTGMAVFEIDGVRTVRPLVRRTP